MPKLLINKGIFYISFTVVLLIFYIILYKILDTVIRLQRTPVFRFVCRTVAGWLFSNDESKNGFPHAICAGR